MKREEIHRRAYEILAISAVSTLPFSKWLSSVSVILLLVNWVLEGNYKAKFSNLASNFPALMMIAFFLYSVTGLIFTTDIHTCLFTVQKKLSLPVAGLTLGSISIYGIKQVRIFFTWFVASMFVASVYCFVEVFVQFLQTGQTNGLFYHALGAPLHLHAVYFSVWILLAIGFLFLEIVTGSYKSLQLIFLVLLLSWLSFFLLLLSSKLIIVIFAVTIPLIALINFRKFLAQRILLLWSLIAVIVCLTIIFSRNPISERFREIYKTETISLNQAGNTIPTEDFNGLNLRLLLWKFGYEIVSEQRAWFFGISGGDSQRLLDEKIKNAVCTPAKMEEAIKGI
jgi:O-antigen ligase